LRRGDGNTVNPPLVGDVLEENIEIDLLRPRGEIAGKMQEAALIERRHGRELRRKQRRFAVELFEIFRARGDSATFFLQSLMTQHL